MSVQRQDIVCTLKWPSSGRLQSEFLSPWPAFCSLIVPSYSAQAGGAMKMAMTQWAGVKWVPTPVE